MPGAFKLDHLFPVEPILFCKYSNFSTFILEANLITPESEKLKMVNLNSTNLSEGVFKLEDLQTGALYQKWCVLYNNYPLLSLLLGTDS